MATVIQEGLLVDPKTASSGLEYDPRKGPAFGFANLEGESPQTLRGISTGDRLVVKDGEWTIRGAKERESS